MNNKFSLFIFIVKKSEYMVAFILATKLHLLLVLGYIILILKEIKSLKERKKYIKKETRVLLQLQLSKIKNTRII